MARFVDLDEDEDVGAGPGGFAVSDPRAAAPHDEVVPPIPPPIPSLGTLHHDESQQNDLSQKDQHLLLLRKLELLSANSRNGPWPHTLYNPEPLGTMDSSTFQSPVTSAFQCYPVVEAIVASIDLNTLDALSRTCRLVHHGLIQYRSTLINSTLHCQNEHVPVDGSETFRYRARAGNWFYMEDGRSYNGKSGDCARDMVGECRRCNDVICRIQTFPYHLSWYRGMCVSAPMTASGYANPVDEVFVPQTMTINGMPYFSLDCFLLLIQFSIWRWRNQYGEVLGGLGTGIGEGDRGVVCGRDADCCAAKEVEHQVDCDAEDARDGNVAPGQGPQQAPVDALIDQLRLTHERTPSPSLGPGYLRHEIEGIGGVVKRKRVRMVRVGRCVPEWDDERSSGSRVLGREVRGVRRSWCGWCNRVIPGEKDLLNEPPSSSSSSDGGSRRTSTSTTRSVEMKLD
ncbi:uncharacterized protein QYS62_004920 [Fusarium acuminatum]|uniref:F-box domain-containing protein n=1 Tax=Fusarium acuminatum TaxID=5515 RepID=A0ABZ2WVF9_9HYPO